MSEFERVRHGAFGGLGAVVGFIAGMALYPIVVFTLHVRGETATTSWQIVFVIGLAGIGAITGVLMSTDSARRDTW